MKRSIIFLIAAVSALGADMPQDRIYGSYIEARTAEVFAGACDANAELGLAGERALLAWNVTEGSWMGVSLKGLSVVAAVRATHTLGDPHHSAYPVKAVLILDRRANGMQRRALKGFAQRMGGDLLSQISRIEYQPIEFRFENNDLQTRNASLTAGALAKIQTRPLEAKDYLCSDEELRYQPLVKLDDAMPAYTIVHTFKGEGLGAQWDSPGKRSAFVGKFNISSDSDSSAMGPCPCRASGSR
jgi:hypothetical protein